MLHHKDKDTTKHYLPMPPLAAMFIMAGCEQPSGLDYDPVWMLADKALRNEPQYKALLYAIVPWLDQAEQRFLVAETEACDINIRLFLNQVRGSSAQFIEGVAWFKIKNIHQDHTYLKYKPFTTALFSTFVELLRVTVNKLRPYRPGLGRATQFVKAGEVIQGLKAAANSTTAAMQTTTQSVATDLTANFRCIVRDEVGRIVAPLMAAHQGAALAPAPAAALAVAQMASVPETDTNVEAPVAAAAAAPDIDPKIIATWPNDRGQWAHDYRPPITSTTKGRPGLPALKNLEDVYGSKWRSKHSTAFKRNILRIKQMIEFMPNEQAAADLHKEFLVHHNVADELLATQRTVCGWSKLRAYNTKYLRPRVSGFQERSEEASKRRKTAKKQTATGGGAAV